MLRTLHLIRHGEVHNPDHVVYADLEGFGLSATGRLQADAAARRLAGTPVEALVASPLQRALETAAPIASILGLEPSADDRLTEWALARRWAGVCWDALPTRFPGELEAYLSRPMTLDFAPESIATVAARMTAVVDELGRRHPESTAVIVSHQDPIQALRLTLTGRSLADLPRDKPDHGSVISLSGSGSRWSETASWAPDVKSSPFPPLGPPNPTQ